ncbi:MAG TPA: hypothetical protein VJS45_10680 [Acidimicrobiia bacterium]|nr:hypothetical protein [Acidimicrobiia bacterium]
MNLFGRRWDRWDALVVAAAAMLVVVRRWAWYTVREEGVVTLWNASTHWELSHAAALGVVAAGVYLVYRGRPEANAAAWMAIFMLLGGLGLVAWHWHHATVPTEKVIISFSNAHPWESPEQYQRRRDDDFAARMASPDFFPIRSAPQSGFYAGTASLIVMAAAIARTARRAEPRRAQAG